MSVMREAPAAVASNALPNSEAELIRHLGSALKASNRHGMPIAEIHIPLDRYPGLASTFWHIPIEDTPEPKVRLIYAAPNRSRHNDAAIQR